MSTTETPLFTNRFDHMTDEERAAAMGGPRDQEIVLTVYPADRVIFEALCEFSHRPPEEMFTTMMADFVVSNLLPPGHRLALAMANEMTDDAEALAFVNRAFDVLDKEIEDGE